jgi:light-regulated signal transduction histidine kinase (bacteriophytochrome)
VILVDLQSNNIQYGDKNAKIIVVQDVTDRLKYIKAIEEQNEKLREISWMQSHLVRAPLARIMGLIPLFKGSQEDDKETSKILEYISTSAEELDQIIKNISGKI